jgi:hypothetical protein
MISALTRTLFHVDVHSMRVVGQWTKAGTMSKKEKKPRTHRVNLRRELAD